MFFCFKNINGEKHEKSVQKMAKTQQKSIQKVAKILTIYLIYDNNIIIGGYKTWIDYLKKNC